MREPTMTRDAAGTASTRRSGDRLRHLGAAALACSIAGTLIVILACGEKAQPAAVTAAPAPAQCAKDTDCKGDRVCQDGKCVAPR